MSKSIDSRDKSELMDALIKFKCIKFGTFKLKSGLTSNVYVNLREVTMFPNLFNQSVTLVSSIVDSIINRLGREVPLAVVGVPYGVVPLSGAVAYKTGLAYYPLRKEVKGYGYQEGENDYDNYRFIMIEDVMSTGSSIIESLEKMKTKRVTDVIVVVDRQHGGTQELRTRYPEVNLHTVIDMPDILKLVEQSKS